MQHTTLASQSADLRQEACEDCDEHTESHVELGRLTYAPRASDSVPAPLCRIAAELGFAADASVARYGDRRDRLIALESGILRLVRGQADGRRHIAAFLYPGDLVCFGESETTWALDVEAVTECKLYALKPCKARLSGERLDGLYRWLFELARQETRRAERHAAILAMPSPADRLAAFLLDIEAAGLRQPENGPETGQDAERLDTGLESIAIPMRRADMADYLALTIETVSRSFGRLVEAGIIRLPHPKRVLVLDRSGLEQHAGLAPLRRADIA